MSIDSVVRNILAESSSVPLQRIIQQGQNDGKVSPDDGSAFITFRLGSDTTDPHQFVEHFTESVKDEDSGENKEIGYVKLKGHDRFTYNITIYGRNAMEVFRLLNAKIRTQSVLNIFHNNKLGFIGFGPVSQFNELVGNKFLYRIDFEIYFNSEISHQFESEIIDKGSIVINGHFDRS